MRIRDDSRGDEDKNRIRNKNSRGTSRKRGGGMSNSGGMGHKEAFFKVNVQTIILFIFLFYLHFIVSNFFALQVFVLNNLLFLIFKGIVLL